MAHAKKPSKFPKSTPEETQASDLLDKEFKITVWNMLEELKEDRDKTLKEIRKMIMNKMRLSINQ